MLVHLSRDVPVDPPLVKFHYGFFFPTGQCKTVDPMSDVLPECNVAYSIFREDKADYGVRWQVLNETNQNVSLPLEYTYKSASSLESFPFWGNHHMYDGGGYVLELRGTIDDMLEKTRQLEHEGWVNEYTRAVFVEFTVYNPQLNLFGIITYLSEHIESAGIFPSFRIEPVNLLSSSWAMFLIQCTFLAFLLFFLVKEIRNILRMGIRVYFQRFWTVVELLIIALSLCAVVLYFYRFTVVKGLLKLFKEHHGNGYIKFQYAGYWTELLMYIIGWLVFLATIKFLRLLRFNKKICMLTATLKHAYPSLVLFSLMFLIVFLAFVQFFFHLYSINLDDFRTFVHAMETCTQMMLGRFDFSAMKTASAVLGPVFFFLYVVTVGYILVNMFITILNEAFTAVRKDVDKQGNDHEMVEFIMSK